MNLLNAEIAPGRVLVVVGTRPEAIKLAPVYRALAALPDLPPVLVSTGQHREMLDQAFATFELRPDVQLGVMRPAQSLAGLTARLIESLDELVAHSRPRGVVVQGDTTSCMAAALVAHYHRIPIAHVEAGLRTRDKFAPFPEEANRRITDQLADLLFAPTRRAAAALEAEGQRDGVHVVGNTVIDSLLWMHARLGAGLVPPDGPLDELVRDAERMVLVTGHRRESFGRGFAEICDALATLAASRPDVRFVYPVHLNPNVQDVVRSRLSAVPNIYLIPPVSYVGLVFLLSRAWLVMTDSGGIQEEAPALGKPVIVMRDTTERPEAVEAGCAVLGGTHAKQLVAAFEAIESDPALHRRMASVASPFGDGQSAPRIAEICRRAWAHA